MNKNSENWIDALVPNYNPNLRAGLESSFWRTTLFLAAAFCLFFILFIRLFHLQIVQGEKNRELADGNRIQIKTIHAPRGVIFDRNSQVLAANSPGFRLVDPQTKKVTFLTHEEALLMEVKNDSRAINLEVDTIRKYPKGAVLAHVLGYVGEISQNQLENPEFKNYSLGDRIGQSGIESTYEKLLSGTDGGEIIEVDSAGRKLRTLRKVAPIPGQNIYLTVDSDLQDQVFRLLSDAVKKSGSCCAAAIASDPASGQILSLVSLPSFDNNIFTDREQSDFIERVLSDPSSPILNRVIGGTYPPGSTYKVITSLAALSSGKITPNTQIEDTGEIFLGAFKFSNWYFTQYGRKEGLVNLVKALKRSNDTFFYRVGQVIGEKTLIEWSHKLKLGERLGIDLPGEVTGLVPDNSWKINEMGDVWYPGDTLHLSIGQGFILTTPMQVSALTSFIAENGKLYKPQLLLRVEKDQNIIQTFERQILIADLLPDNFIKTIQQGLEEVTKDGGTAWPFFTFPIKTAGKTGTAEYGDPKNRTHAWYTGYAPVEDPKIVMTVLVEGGGEGSSVAAPVVKETFRWYFSEDKNNLIKDVFAASESAKILGE